MARSTKSDPLRNFKFRVTIQPKGSSALASQAAGLGDLGFSVVSGVSVQNELIAYREGGMNTHPHKMIGQSDFGPVTFSKGVFAHEASLYRWQQFLHSWNQGGQNEGSRSGNNDYRCDIMVVVYDHPVSTGPWAEPGQVANNQLPAGSPKFGYKLFNCWPGSYSITDMNAGDSSILIQQLVVNHEGFHIEWATSVDGQIDTNALAGLG
jgi:phage tail-like protein